jgi:hypothetical protein
VAPLILPEVSPTPRPGPHPRRLAIVTEEELAAYRKLAPAGPWADWRARHDAWSRGDQQDLEPNWLAASQRYERIQNQPQMKNLSLLAHGLADYRQSALLEGQHDVAAALFEGELTLVGLGSDGEVSPGVVRAHACALEPLAGSCQLAPWPGCGAAERLGWMAGRICDDPFVQLPRQQRRTANAHLPLGDPRRWSGPPTRDTGR